MTLYELIKNQRGKIPVPLIIIFVLIVLGAVVAVLATQGIIVIPGITPEEPVTTEVTDQIEIDPEDQLAAQVQSLFNDKRNDEQQISDLEELVELKDERIDNLQAEIARLQGLVELADESAVKDVAAVYEKMSPENAVDILVKFDPEKTVLILAAMEEKKSAPILEGMDPDYAARITEIMAGFVKPFGSAPSATPPAHPKDE